MSHVWADESCPEQPRRPRERRQVRGLVVHTPWRRRRKSRHFPSLRFVHFACLFETNTTIIIGSELLSAYSPDQTVPPTACDQPPHSSLAPTTSQARGHALDLNGRKRAFVQKHPAKGAARPGAGASPVRGIAQPHPARHPAAVLFPPVCIQSMGWPNLDSPRGTGNSTRPPHRAEPAAGESRTGPPRRAGQAGRPWSAQLGWWDTGADEAGVSSTVSALPLSFVHGRLCPASSFCVVTCRPPPTSLTA